VPVRLLDDGHYLVLGDCLRVAPGVVGELDQIDAAAALLPRLDRVNTSGQRRKPPKPPLARSP